MAFLVSVTNLGFYPTCKNEIRIIPLRCKEGDIARQGCYHGDPRFGCECFELESLGLLYITELFVDAIKAIQLVVRSSLNHTAFVDHEDFMGMLNGAKAVGNYETRSVLHQVEECLLN